jgi:hypothetical protein
MGCDHRGRDKRICPRLRPHARMAMIGAYACIRPGRLASGRRQRLTWRTKVPVVEAHIPAHRHSRAKKRALAEALNQSLVRGLGIPKATASS